MSWRRFFTIFASISGVVVLALWSFLFIVPETKWALVLQFGGVRGEPRPPGLHVVLPIVQDVIMLERRTLTFRSPAEEIIASDQKRLLVDAIALYKIVDPVRFYITLGSVSVAESRLSSLVNSSIRSILAQSTFQEVVRDNRDGLMKNIKTLLGESVRDYGLDITGFRLRRVDVPLANSQAIYRRMQTEREQEAAEIRAIGQQDKREIIARAERDSSKILSFASRDSDIIRGYGDACRSRIFAHVTSQGQDFFSFYRTLQAYRKAFQKGNTSFLLGENGDFFRFFQHIFDDKEGASPSIKVEKVVSVTLPSPSKLCGNLASRAVTKSAKP